MKEEIEIEKQDNLEEKPVKEKKQFKALIIYIAVILLVEIFIVPMIMTAIYGPKPAEVSETLLGINTGLNLLVYSVILLAVYAIIYHKRINEDIRRTKAKKFLIWILYGIGFIIVNYVLSTIFSKLGTATENQDALNNGMKAAALITFFPTGLFVPFVEEMVFRYAFSTIIKNKVVFVIVSSFFFAIMHGIGVITILYFILGVLLALIYLKNDKNILASTTVHVLNNTLSVLPSLLSLFF